MTRPAGTTLPVPVAELCADFLAQTPPGLVDALHLRGGLGFGEWVEGRSDVDFVAVLSRRPDAADLRGLRAVHARLAERHRTPFDGYHLLAADLAGDPRRCPDVPGVLHGHFEDEHAVHEAVVVWHELARAGVTVAGPPLAAGEVWGDDEVLREFTRTNLDTYWRDTAVALAAMPGEAARETSCSWCVLGVARLDHLLITGEMTTKSRAGHWGLAHYPARFHRVLREALRLREDPAAPSAYDDPAARGRDVAAFTAHVVAAGAG